MIAAATMVFAAVAATAAPADNVIEICRVVDGAPDCLRYADDCSKNERVAPNGAKTSCPRLDAQRCQGLRSMAKLQATRVRNLRAQSPGGFDQRMPASQCPHFYVRGDADSYASACIGDDARGADGLFRFYKFASSLCGAK